MIRYDVTEIGFRHITPGGEFVKYEDAQAAIQQAVLAEREACAKLAEGTWEADEGGSEDESGYPRYGENSARAIRARNTP